MSKDVQQKLAKKEQFKRDLKRKGQDLQELEERKQDMTLEKFELKKDKLDGDISVVKDSLREAEEAFDEAERDFTKEVHEDHYLLIDQMFPDVQNGIASV